MGIRKLYLILLLLLSVEKTVLGFASPSANSEVSKPIDSVVYRKVLKEGDIDEIRSACINAAKFSLNIRLQKLSERLLEIAPAPQPFDVVLKNAQALLECKAPDAAGTVLGRFSPDEGSQRKQWLLLSWRAASAAMDHERASQVLQRLVRGNISELDSQQIIVGYLENGSPVRRSALDLLVEHELALGRSDSAGIVLLAGSKRREVRARRLFLAAQIMKSIDIQKRINLLDLAFEQAYAEQSWDLAKDILTLQLELDLALGGDGEGPRQRLKSLLENLEQGFDLGEPGEEKEDLN